MAKGNEKSGGGGNSKSSSNSGSKSNSSAKSGAANVQLPNIPRLNYSTTDKSSARGRGREAYTRQNIADQKANQAAAGKNGQQQAKYGTDPASAGGVEQAQEQQSSQFSEEANSKGSEQKQNGGKDRNFLAEAMEETVGKPESEKPVKQSIEQPKNTAAQGKQAEEDADMDAGWAALEAKSNEKDQHAENYRNYLNEADRLTIEKTNSEGLTMEELDEYDRQIKEARDKAEEERKAAGIKNTKDKWNELRSAPLLSEDEQEAWAFLGPNEDVENQVGGWGRQYAAGPAMAVGTALEWFDKASDDMVRYEYDQEHGEGAYDRAIAGKNVNQVGQLGNKLWDTGVGLQESGQQMWEAGTADMSDLGREIANVAKTGTDVVGDIALNSVLPGLGTMRMYMGAAGNSAYEQSQRENSDVDSRMVAAVKGGLSAYLSNKLVGGLDAAYGESILGKQVHGMLGKTSPEVQQVLKPLLNTEGIEEGLEDILNYAADQILGLDSGKPLDWNEVKQDAFIGYVLGVLTNGLAGGMNIDNKMRQNIAKGGIEFADFAEQGGTIEEAAEIGRQNTRDQVVLKAAPEAETGPEVRRVEQAPEGQPSSTITVPLTETAPMETSQNPMIAAIQERMTISPREAAQIRNNPELRAAFEEAYGISLDGLGEKAAAQAITDAVKNQGVHERSVNQFGEVPEAAPSFAPAETGPNKSERAFARGGEARDAIASILAGDDISRKDATRIMSNPVMWEAFQDATGIDLSKKGKTEQNVREAFREAKANQNQEAQADLQTQLAEAEAELDNYLDGLQGTPGELKTPEYNDLVNRVNDLRSQLGMEPEAPATETTAETNANETESEAVPKQEETAAPEETPNPKPSESNAKPQQKQQNRKPDHSRKVTNPDEDTDAEFDKLNEKHGSIEPGENPAREINVPKKDTKGLKVGEGARTIFEADATPDERIASLKAAVVNGNFGHVPVSNDTRSKNAAKKLAKDGWSQSVADFLAAADSGRADADTIALGAHLLNEAGNSTECSGKQYVQLAMAYNDAVSDAGSRLAAGRILKTLTPEGKLYGIEKTIEKMNKKIRDGNEKKGPNRQKPEIKLDEGLVEDYLNAETDEERDLIHDEIIRDAAAQVPNTLRDKFTALRYLNMLGNFKTQVRNVAGNIGMGLVQKTKNEVVSAIEGAASAVTGGKYERRYKGLYAPSLHRAAVEDFNSNKSLQDAAMGEAKFSDVGKQARSDIENAKDPFSNRNPLGWVLNKYSKATTGAMEIGDKIFVRSTYADALAGYLNAHKITAADWKAMVNDPAKAAEVDRARSYAVKQAQEATFRDTNKLSKFVSSFDQNWGRVPKAIAQGVIPFRKTPANVLVRMEEYSPLGIVNTGVKAAQAAKGNADASEVIDSFAKTLTGTAITALGYMLAAQGRVRTREDDKEQDRLDKLAGKQDYSVEFDLPEQLGGGRRSFTLDWLTPAAGAFFMGSELHDIVETGGITPSEALTTLESFTNPMLEMSMLSGVNDALNNISDFNGDQSAMLQFALNSAWSYLTQGLTNTMLGQAEQFSEDYRQTYYTDKENTSLTPSAQKKLAKLGNKTPGFDYQSADYIDAWGRRQESDPNKAVRAGNVFFNPGYVSKMDEKATAVDDMLQDLYKFGKDQTERDDFPRVIPQTPSRYTTVNGTQLTPKEYEVYATAAGRNKLDLVTKLSKSEQFKNMDKYAQAETISELYKYADFLAASRIAQNRGEEYYDKQYSGIKDLDNPVGYIAAKNSFNVATRGEKYDFDAIDALMPNIVKMSDKDRDYLRSKNSQAMSYYDYMTPNAHGYNVDSSEDVFNLKAMEKENATERGVKQASGIDTMKAIEDGYKQNKFSDDDVNALMTKQASDGDYDLSKGRVAIYLAAIASGKTVDEAFQIVNSADRDSNGKIDEKGLYITPEREGTKALKRAGINKAGQRAFDEIMYPNGRGRRNNW